MWKDQRIIMFDVETTGLSSAKGDRVIELGVCLIEERQIRGQWSQVFDPEIESLNPKITEITGLKHSDLIGQPKFASMADKLQVLSDRAFCYAAYNAPFDHGFVSSEYEKAGINLGDKFWLDPLIWARKYDGSEKNKLTDVCARHDIEIGQAHRAGDDAQGAAEVLLKFIDRLPEDFESVKSLQQLWRRNQDAVRARKYRRRR